MPRYVTRGTKTRQARYRKRGYSKKKTYRRPARPSRGRRRTPRMSQKSILNLTARKKRDTMLQWRQDAGVDGAGTAVIPPKAGNNGATTIFAWAPTARDLNIGTTGGRGTVSDIAARTASTVYNVGLKETIKIYAQEASSYMWRRICFTSKGLLAPLQSRTPISLLTSNGWVRYTKDLTSGGSGQAAALDVLRSVLFKGQLGVDWNDYITAPTDNQRVTIKYDRTTTLRSRGDDEIFYRTTRWHPMYKNMVYDDDEIGEDMAMSTTSTQGKQGMGDYIVIDIIQPGPNVVGNGASAQIDIESTMYWHER